MSSVAANSKASPMDALQRWLPKLVLAPSMFIVLVGFYGYILWTFALSFTNSTFLPSYKWVGLAQYARLMDNDRWWVAIKNLAVFGGMFIAISLVIGVLLAVLLDQRIRREGMIRTIYLYPMALSMIVTGTAWKWLLNPGLGLDKMLRDWGWEGFRFDWLIDQDRVVYCLVIAAVWQSSGFVMALFLAGLRGVDQSIIRAAQMDGASLPMIYWRVVLPSLRPVFFSAVMILAHIAIKSFDLVAAMTAGGPGYSSDLPAMFMYSFTFSRGQMGMGSASAILMLGAILAILVPYLYSELRTKRHD
ncbi:MULTISPECIES: carbohydrate ABC transporter permease [Pseudomonas syringae group]|uniref:Binding-protein dependent transport system inner membrane protein n=4 Tax=Pseudomonas syringae group TaxID=136849 RepID=F3G5V5_PSESJ|nr:MULTISPECIES: sugar ABC transporter permease [Pseudomonas syringae group]EGH42455.1 binding-protein dependent transport system inner membrane protein [Pseudomonas syringae pv. pisi str. 1704B]RMU73892.1 Binding-protein dependent transport system inner membrane protein [Pseudomonas syringae pv. aptata]PYD17186.1 sugar ABC transporter permease [Pseudomonas syringae pv. pisi]PYD31912.1 sugar ABC transporter permease [Pseudomonas syringae pv. pisi]PYD34712.1 sugar ABC transporter permease [Pseu